MKKELRFGIFGLYRGMDFIGSIRNCGAEVTAICDYRPAAIAKCKEKFFANKEVEAFSDFDRFIKADFDVVILTNYFSEHAAYAIKAMKAGKHVLSETLSNVTMAEGVALCRAKEETGMTYALLENYPYFKENQEMGRIFKTGTLGELVYAEGEYIHPMPADMMNDLNPGERHWRNWTPKTYYSTHALAPLMMMTDSMPTKVCAMAAFQPSIYKNTAVRHGDAAAIILCETDKNAVFRVIGCGAFQPHGSHYRLCCTKGGVEVSPTNGNMRVCYNYWDRPEDVAQDVTEYPIPWQDESLAKYTEGVGHGGGDFFVIYDVINDLREGREPYWNVYRATATASVAILAWRSVLNDNRSYQIPDFRKEEDKLKYEYDAASPYPDENYHVTIPCSSQPYAPSDEDMTAAREVWKDKDFLLR